MTYTMVFAVFVNYFIFAIKYMYTGYVMKLMIIDDFFWSIDKYYEAFYIYFSYIQ